MIARTHYIVNLLLEYIDFAPGAVELMSALEIFPITIEHRVVIARGLVETGIRLREVLDEHIPRARRIERPPHSGLPISRRQFRMTARAGRAVDIAVVSPARESPVGYR